MKFDYHVHGMTSLRQAVGSDLKNIHYIWFSHFILTSHISAENIPFRCTSLKTAF